MDKVKLALGILSGRVDWSELNDSDWLDLGYDPDSFSYYGMPHKDGMLDKAEDIVLNAIIRKED